MDSPHSLSQTPDWWIDGATPSPQSVTSDWEFTGRTLIHDVTVKDVRAVPKPGGMVIELFRRDWGLDAGDVAQAFAVVLLPGTVSAWHVHETARDRLFALNGLVKIVLYDARRSSPTYGLINEFMTGSARHTLVTIPPGVWHGVQNIGHDALTLMNLPDQAYRYEAPDHWRLPADSEQIPYRFARLPGASGV